MRNRNLVQIQAKIELTNKAQDDTYTLKAKKEFKGLTQDLAERNLYSFYDEIELYQRLLKFTNYKILDDELCDRLLIGLLAEPLQ